MADPFQKQEEESRVTRLWDAITQRDKRDERQGQVETAKAAAALDWMDHPYFPHFMVWVEEQIDKPVGVRDHTQMIADTARCNTFKELRQHLRHLRQNAEAVAEGPHE